MKRIYPPQDTSPLSTWLEYIKHLHSQTIELDLERIKYVANQLRLLKPAPFVFTVGGTNGKGTTCRMLEILLLSAGYRVGVYSSPHLINYTERVRINGREVNELLHSSSFALIEAARDDIPLTYFEFSTLSALNLFYKANLDIVILEVGLGGRLDATNIVNADTSVITNIALDHTDFLGQDRESIGREKAGIFRCDKPAIVGDINIVNSIANVAAEKGAHLYQCGRDWQWERTLHTWRLQDNLGELCDIPLPQIPLSNAATALSAIRIAGFQINTKVIIKLLPLVTLLGRFQTIRNSPRVILDVAHNPHAAHYLCSRLASQPKTGKLHAVVGILHDKDISGILSALVPQVDYWYCASLQGQRGTLAEKLMSYLNNSKGFKDVNTAWKVACGYACPQDTILVFGSFYTVSQVLNLISVDKGSSKNFSNC